jgi:putative tryptophan/tyrosine transport system substrate-binding protein
MDRRAATTLICSLLAPSGAPLAQVPGRRPRIGFLAEPPLDEVMQRAIVGPFRKGLHELGYVENQNIFLEFRSAEGMHERLPALARELVELKLEVLVTAFPAAALAAKAATRELPIVAASVDNPVDMGLATTMARPGGNITGVSGWAGELVEKRLQLLHELAPTARRVGILFNRDSGVTRDGLERGIVRWQRTLGIEIRAYEARRPGDFEGVFAVVKREGVGGLVVLADGNTYTHRKELNDLCLERQMPSVWGGRDFLTGGGLASYQSDFPAIFRRAATLVDYILKGQKPADIPFEQATKLELIVDKRAAKALGITLPPTVLLAADEVFE